MISLCVDPGVRACGAAIFSGRDLIHAALVVNPIRKGRTTPANLSMGRAVYDWWGSYYPHGVRPDLLCLEFPQIYPGMPDTDLNDLLDLAGVDGVIAALLAPVSELTSYFPSQWKGNVAKSVMTHRIEDHLSVSERANIVRVGSKDHNTLDAIGIGLHRFGRLTNKIYPR